MRHLLTSLLLLGCLATLPLPLIAQDPGSEFQFVETNGIRMAYRIQGEGEPLLLLHGFGDTEATWDPILADLASDYRVILPQLRGHGQSTNPSGEFTHRVAAQDVLGLLDALGIEEVRAAGHSTGGMTLLHMATAQADRVSAMALLGSTTYFPEQARQMMRMMSPENMPPGYMEEMARRHGGAERAGELMRQFSGFQDSYDDMNFTPPLLSTISARTLIVHGDRDIFFPTSIPVEMYDAIPESYLMVLPNWGHAAIPTDEEGRAFLVSTLKRLFAGEWACTAGCANR